MRPRLLLLSVLVLLGACQSGSIDRDYDPTRDFAAYRSWSWQEPAVRFQPDDPRLDSDLTRQRIRQAVAEQLDQRGLRAAPNGTQADLKVQVWWIVDQREEQVTTHYGGDWGAPGWPGYWGGPGLVETRNLSYRVATLQLDLLDARDGKLVWRGSAEQVQSERPRTPEERSAAIRTTLGRVLEHYPPR